jgi:hypothetical protein
VNNTGSADATISTIMVNGIPIKDPITINSIEVAGVNQTGTNAKLPVSLPVGKGATFELYITKNSDWGGGKLSSGITVNVVLHTAAGKDYPASVTLP